MTDASRAAAVEEITVRHDKRLSAGRRTIKMSPTKPEALSAFVLSVSALPGVSVDPGTRADILSLAEELVSWTPDVSRRSDVCWINGPHREHSWVELGENYTCLGRLSAP